MSLEPFFSLTPLNPRVYTYDPAAPDAPYVHAFVAAFGAHLVPVTFDLEHQYNNDQIFVAYDPVPDTEQVITSVADDIYRRCSLRLTLRASGVRLTNQYLFVFRLTGWLPSGRVSVAQFFVGNSLIRAEPLSERPHDDIAILLDAPADDSTLHQIDLLVRLAGHEEADDMETIERGFIFRGVDCYLL